MTAGGKPGSSRLPELEEISLGRTSFEEVTFELKVIHFGSDDQPSIAWVWRERMKLGYLAGFTRDELLFRTHGGLPVDRVLTWPKDADDEMFERFRKLWADAGYPVAEGSPQPAPGQRDSADSGPTSYGSFTVTGSRYLVFQVPDEPTTVRFSRDGREVGKVEGVGGPRPRLRLHTETWPPYRRNRARQLILELVAKHRAEE